MKKIIVIICLIHVSLTGMTQAKNVQQIFDTYQDMEGIISVNVARPMFSLLNKIKINTGEKTISNLQPMLKGINSLKLLVVENDLLKEITEDLPVGKPVKLSPEKLQQLTKEINQAVSALNYMELMTVNASGRKLKFLTAKSDGNILDNLLLSITTATEGNLLFFLDGKIAMEDVNKFIAAEND